MQDKAPFDRFGLDPALVRAVRALGYEAPTPIQREAIPPILASRDVIGTAQTGSGKTAAFLLPILQRLMHKAPGRTRALVLSPTRELAAQTEAAFRGFAKGTRLRAHAVYGGVGMAPQEHALRGGVDVVVATPGRLLDHMGRRNVDFRGLEVLVLDEADRMLDMGFLPDVRRIVDALPRERQTLLFAATMPPEIEALSRSIMRDPVRISVSAPDRWRRTGSPSRGSMGTGARVSGRWPSKGSGAVDTRSSSPRTSRPGASTWRASRTGSNTTYPPSRGDTSTR